MNTVLIIAAAVISSSALTTVVDRVFSRKNSTAEVGRTNAEAADILSQASSRTLQMMQSSLAVAQQRILDLEHRVQSLEADLIQYRSLHGPLPPPGPGEEPL